MIQSSGGRSPRDRSGDSAAPRQLMQPAIDALAYRAHRLIKGAPCRLRHWRAVATSYDAIAREFFASIFPVTDWLR